MILLLSDVHTLFAVVNAQIEHAERRLGRPLAAAVVLGDMGLFEPELRRFFRREGQRFARPVFFLEGNHEDFDLFEHLIGKYAEFFTYLPRGSPREIDGHRIVALGGSAYMDPAATPPKAVIAPEDIEKSGLTYLALGHVHQYSGPRREGGTVYAYPGTPDGRGFDELGEKGVILGRVSDGGEVDLDLELGHRLGKDMPALPVAVGVLLQVDEVFFRKDLERVAQHLGLGMWRRL